MTPEIMTLAEAAAFLRLSERKLYGLVGERRLPVARVDGRLLFPRRLLDAWLAERVEAGPRAVAPPPVLAGSHDPLLEWAARESGCGLALLTDGSGDGLRRLAAGEATVAGLHLPAEDGGDDGDGGNVAAVRALGLPDLVLLAWARRRQGLVLPPGNPAGVGSLADVAARGLTFARRQEGAGAQLLLENLLSRAGIAGVGLRWTPAPCRTETDLAAAVLDGQADGGLAVEAVARRFRLAFVPLAEERFDLALRRRDYFEPPVQRLLAFARTTALAERAEALGGYDVAELGEVRFNA